MDVLQVRLGGPRLARRAAAVVVAACAALLVGVLPAGAVTSSLYASGVTGPGGLIWIGSHLWVSDHRLGFCRLDGPTGSGTYTLNPATCGTASGLPGQVSYQAETGFVYVPDAASTGQGVWRLSFDVATETVGSPVLLAPNAGLAGERTTATALGSDGNLYLGFAGRSDILRVVHPGGETASQIVQKIGQARESGVTSLAFIGRDLYLAERSGVTALLGALSCRPRSPCDASETPVRVAAPTALTSDGRNVLWFADTVASTSSVLSYNRSTGAQGTYTTSGLLSPTTTARFLFGTALALDPTGHLYIADDPANGHQPGTGRIWRVTPGGL
jgi:hypothetical protein